ncbi:LLM class flavin-dependent oxidoreductase [Actinomadura decatromicini]|uniref:LLM class flavin-dependent oxidoreductase n=1 Tax=Actinomadura decatromicini TaxID=2604572 RepID=A0A5D3F8F6_9ACTN|nr:LLM class flavin-dependent oxidoreductase [Actinomadura decatromicini]TYK44611.1 LLM class flavin-dependent oxidoreductase [Actinomadura decatromicini]
MTAYSIMMPFVPARPHQILPYAALTQWSGAHRLWQGQADVSDAHQTFVFAAASGFRVPVGTGVLLMPSRHPAAAAQLAQTLAMAVGHPVVAGYGPGAASYQRALLGAPYRSPLTATREYLTIMRGLLDGKEVEHAGEYFSCHLALRPVPSPPVEVGVGVLGPAMARVAGALADVAITLLTPADHLREVIVPALREGAEAAGRPAPRLVSVVPAALDADGRDLPDVVVAGHSRHLRLPHYAAMLRRSGVDVDTADPRAAATALLKGGAFAGGGLADVRERLGEHAEAGADEIVLNLSGVHVRDGGPVALRELHAILEEVTASR